MWTSSKEGSLPLAGNSVFKSVPDPLVTPIWGGLAHCNYSMSMKRFQFLKVFLVVYWLLFTILCAMFHCNSGKFTEAQRNDKTGHGVHGTATVFSLSELISRPGVIISFGMWVWIVFYCPEPWSPSVQPGCLLRRVHYAPGTVERNMVLIPALLRPCWRDGHRRSVTSRRSKRSQPKTSALVNQRRNSY